MAAIAGQMAVARGAEQAPPALPPQLFKEVNELRDNKSKEKGEDEHVKWPKSNNIFGRIAVHSYFSSLTFFFIGVNSLYIGIDADYSATNFKPDDLYDKDTPVWCVVMENVFCIYFTGEVLIRFISYKNKCHCFLDPWFRFDSALVTLMVLETWILPMLGVASALAQLSVLRLLRLLRISRMARLMKKVPELMIILKGLVASFRSVGCTAILQVAILYVFSIIFVAEYHEKGGDDDNSWDDGHITYYFGTMAKSFYSLFIFGTILDDVTQVTDIIRGAGGNWQMMLTFFILFIMFSSFTVLNMLIGILCEVVAATADSEKQKAAETCVKEAMVTVFDTLDQDGNGTICEEEFVQMRDGNDASSEAVKAALEDMDILDSHFNRYCEILFHASDDTGKTVKLSFETVINMILRLSPGNHVNALDFSLLQASIDSSQEALSERVKKLKDLVAECRYGGPSPSRPVSRDQTRDQMGGNELRAQTPPSRGQDSVKAAMDRGLSSMVMSQIRDPLGPESGYQFEAFDKISSNEILEELERRLGVTGTFESKVTQPDAEKEFRGPDGGWSS